MIKKLIKRAAFVAVLTGAALLAQLQTPVTATIVDPNGKPYAGGTWAATFASGPVGFGQPASTFIGDGPVNPQFYRGSINAAGSFSASLWSASSITPAGSSWVISFCDTTGVYCGSAVAVVNGPSTIDLSALLSGVAKALPIGPNPGFTSTALANGPYKVAKLPVGQAAGTLANVSDGTNASDCAVGGGSSLNLCQWNGSTWAPYSASSSSGGTGPFIDTGGAVYNLLAYPNLQAAINAACAGGNNNVVDMGGVNTPLVQGTQVTFTCPIKFQNCHTTITANMADPGQGSGAFVFASDGVSLEGIVGNNRACVLTRANGSNVQNLIYTGNHSHLSLTWLTYDGNETNQTYTNSGTTYYTGWHTSALGGGSDLTFSHNYVTRGGQRSIDWRGVSNTHLDFNTFVDNGINVGGSHGSRGNSVSIDIGYNNPTVVPSTDNWCINNYDTCHGDSFRCGNLRAHVLGNHIYGCVTEGGTPWFTETGIDAYGLIDSYITGNYITDTFNNAISLEDYLILGTEYTPARDSVADNDMVCDTSVNVVPFGSPGAKATCMLVIGNAGNGTTLTDISLTGNHITGAPFVLDNINGLVETGNTLNTNVVNTYTATPALQFLSGANMANFTIQNNSFSNTTSAGINIGNTVTSPSPCKVLNNNFNAVSTTISYGTGGSATLCDVSGAATSVSPTTINQYSTDNVGASLIYQKARGTTGSPSTVVDFDQLGVLNFKGHDGTNFVQTAIWSCYPIGTISTGVIPGQCKFLVNNSSGASTLVSSFDPTAFRVYSQLNVFNSAGTFAHNFVANATATRTFTLPDANSNPVQPLGSATSGKVVQYIDNTGTQNLLSVAPAANVTNTTTDAICAHANDTSVTFVGGSTTCNNTTTDSISGGTPQYFSQVFTVPANYFTVSGKSLHITANLAAWSTSTAPTNTLRLYHASTIGSNQGGATSVTASMSHAIFSASWVVTATSAADGHVITSPIYIGTPGALASATYNATTQPVAAGTSGYNIQIWPFWSATGVASGTYTSGGSITGNTSQTCTCATFNNSCSGTTATIALTGTNTIAGGTAWAITNTGIACASAPTSCTLGSGTATCSGTATISTTLGGAQGNAMQLLGLTVTQN